MVKILSLSFPVRNFLPGENPGQPFVRGAEARQPSSGQHSGTPGLGTPPASHHLGLLLRRREPGGPRVTQPRHRQAPSRRTPRPGAGCEASLATGTRLPSRPAPRAGCGSAADPRDGLGYPTGGRPGQDKSHPLARGTTAAIFPQRPAAHARRAGASAAAAPLPAARQVPLLPRPRPSAPPPPALRAGEGRPRAGMVLPAAGRELRRGFPRPPGVGGWGGRAGGKMSPFSACPAGGLAGYAMRSKGQGRA